MDLKRLGDFEQHRRCGRTSHNNTDRNGRISSKQHRQVWKDFFTTTQTGMEGLHHTAQAKKKISDEPSGEKYYIYVGHHFV